MKKTLYVKHITWRDLSDHWNNKADILSKDYVHMLGLGIGPHCVFIRCTQSGEINWDKAPVYSLTELIERDHVRIVK